ETARLVMSSPPPPAGVFVLMTGLNDVRLNGPDAVERESYADALGTIFAAFRRASPGALVLAVEQPYVSDYVGYEPFHRGSDGVLDAYNATLRQVASQHSVRVGRIEGWNVEGMVSVDGVHPNDAGHRQLAQAVVDECLQSRWFTDQKAAPRSAASALRWAGRMSR
ncbi:MAG TPA: GDSL-type esterase/lipase family protein, partial [Microlunatus sp.]